VRHLLPSRRGEGGFNVEDVVGPTRATDHPARSVVDVEPVVVDDLTLAAARRGDGTAFVAILKHYDRRMRLIATRLLGERGLMDDALQEVAIKTARALPGLRDPATLGAWLCRVTYTTCLDLLRREKRLMLMAPGQMPEGHASSGADFTDALADREAVAQLLATLSPELRLTVILVDQEDLDYATTAQILGIPSGTVASRVSTARAALRRSLALRSAQEES
jgi:RNA polymerase sigma-70 factor (ECF subfamily)